MKKQTIKQIIETQKKQMKEYGCCWEGINEGICSTCKHRGKIPVICERKNFKVFNSALVTVDYCKDYEE